ncbi:TonB-dependent receptor [Sphingorhabdus sp. YGSMI21]|uniref:TonB-dependent receptor plug domain-containing protein n=1 Tax=Sphingorhabdus sp. YGSMI21 TaxID=2077182 RepID=UPI0013DC109B|nr:TonB-dependent receptor [Sphingorhabdus sp. YGSMI21]
MKKLSRSAVGSIAFLSLSATAAHAQLDAPDEDDVVESGQDDSLLDMQLEELLTLEATSVAKKRQKVSESAAAVFIITQEDIRRSTASSIPDLLRMVPGLEVATLQNSVIAVTARGFSGRFGNSVLVMVDGRTIYTNNLSGVRWDQLMLPLDEIERIEVVRGPGAALWGSNAVNGVINIISKHGSDLQGGTADVRIGLTKQQANGSYGGRFDENISYRIYANATFTDGLRDGNGDKLAGRYHGRAIGGRMDYEPSGADAFTLAAEYSKGDFDIPALVVRQDLLNPGYDPDLLDGRFSAFHVLGRWTHEVSEDLDWSFQAYYDRSTRFEYDADIQQDMVDLDFGLRWKASDTHEINVGLAARSSVDTLVADGSFKLSNERRSDQWLSGYIQDDITLIPDSLRLTAGSKIEFNSFSGTELQPSARLFYRPAENFAVWAGVSRAARTPSGFERDAELRLTVGLPDTPGNPFSIPIYPVLFGDPDLKSERSTSYEAGFRAQIADGWSLDVAAYRNIYSRIVSLGQTGQNLIFQEPLTAPVGIELPVAFNNNGLAKTWGAEIALSGRIALWWNIDVAYSHLDMKTGQVDGLTSPGTTIVDPNLSPENQLSIRNAIDFGDKFSFDSQFRHVGALEGSVPSYNSADIRLTYRPIETVELSLIGENLLQKRRLEYFQEVFPAPAEYVSRTASIQARVRF